MILLRESDNLPQRFDLRQIGLHLSLLLVRLFRVAIDLVVIHLSEVNLLKRRIRTSTQIGHLGEHRSPAICQQGNHGKEARSRI